MVDVDYCLPVRQIADVLGQLVGATATGILKAPSRTTRAQKRNQGEEKLRNRLHESIATAEKDLKLLRDFGPDLIAGAVLFRPDGDRAP
jgi:hypothetical protein